MQMFCEGIDGHGIYIDGRKMSFCRVLKVVQ